MISRSRCLHCIVMEYVNRHYNDDDANQDLAVINALMEVQGDILAQMPVEVKIQALEIVKDNIEMLLIKVSNDAWKNSRDYDWLMSREPTTETRN